MYHLAKISLKFVLVFEICCLENKNTIYKLSLTTCHLKTLLKRRCAIAHLASYLQCDGILVVDYMVRLMADWVLHCKFSVRYVGNVM